MFRPRPPHLHTHNSVGPSPNTGKSFGLDLTFPKRFTFYASDDNDTLVVVVAATVPTHSQQPLNVGGFTRPAHDTTIGQTIRRPIHASCAAKYETFHRKSRRNFAQYLSINKVPQPHKPGSAEYFSPTSLPYSNALPVCVTSANH